MGLLHGRLHALVTNDAIGRPQSLIIHAGKGSVDVIGDQPLRILARTDPPTSEVGVEALLA